MSQPGPPSMSSKRSERNSCSSKSSSTSMEASSSSALEEDQKVDHLAVDENTLNNSKDVEESEIDDIETDESQEDKFDDSSSAAEQQETTEDPIQYDFKPEPELVCNETMDEECEDETMEPLVLSDDDPENEPPEEREKIEKPEKVELKRKKAPPKTPSKKSRSKSRKKPSPRVTVKREASVEVEISQGEKSDEEMSIATRRSSRRKTKVIKEWEDFPSFNPEITERGEIGETIENAETPNSEVEEVGSASDVESLASGSTLTTRSARKRRTATGPSSKRSPAKKCRKSGQMSKSKTRTVSNALKGKSRRHIFKKSVTKAPSAVARAITSERVYFKGQYFTKGDIVAVTNIDGGTFYAQLRGFLTDQYCEKSCVITWLLPTKNSPDPDEGFDPATYVIGPEEDLPRKLEYFTFVMHAPHDYFYYKNSPYPTESVVSDQEYVLTRLGPKVRLINSDGKEFFGNV